MSRSNDHVFQYRHRAAKGRADRKKETHHADCKRPFASYQDTAAVRKTDDLPKACCLQRQIWLKLVFLAKQQP
jgi:hypothetical protein